MDAVAHLLVLGLLAITVSSEPCVKRSAPYYDCQYGPNNIFFPHPDDCTFLIVCMGTQDVAVSLCDETEHMNVNDPKYTLGCPKRCAAQPPGCPPDSKIPSNNPSTNSPFNPLPGFYPPAPTPASPRPPGRPTRPAPSPTQRPTQRPTPPPTTTQPPTTTTQPNLPTGHPLTCKRSGIVAHPYDCMKAFVCPNEGFQAILFNICENVGLDSSFPVGCPEMCPGWLPDVNGYYD